MSRRRRRKGRILRTGMLRLMPAPGIGKAMGRIMAKDMQAKSADVAARLIGKDDPPRESVG